MSIFILIFTVHDYLCATQLLFLHVFIYYVVRFHLFCFFPFLQRMFQFCFCLRYLHYVTTAGSLGGQAKYDNQSIKANQTAIIMIPTSCERRRIPEVSPTHSLPSRARQQTNNKKWADKIPTCLNGKRLVCRSCLSPAEQNVCSSCASIIPTACTRCFIRSRLLYVLPRHKLVA